jgi:glycosyltransferase involved in cell wall biosynthesis
MACETPVVATAVGGIPEIVVPGETGLLVPLEAERGDSPEPKDPDSFSRALAHAVNELMAAPDRRQAMGKAARARVLEHFSWAHIAQVTLEFYRELIDRRRGRP